MTLRTILPRRRLLLALVLAAAGLAATPLAARADVFDPTCHGRLALGQNRADGEVAYRVACSDDIAGYSIVLLNRQVAGFETEGVAFDFQTGNPASGQDWSCSGPIPGFGISCAGKATGGNKIVGGLSLLDDPCVGKRPDAVLTVSDATGRQAGPFPLFTAKPGPAARPLDGCPTPRRALTRRVSRARHR
jgi:hypothetical protein